jgi:hypothetical protein
MARTTKSKKDNRFGMRMNDSDFKRLTELANGRSKTDAVLELIDKAELIPELPQYYVQRLRRICDGKKTNTLSKMITVAITEKWGVF